MVTFTCPEEDCDCEQFRVRGTIRSGTPIVTSIECIDCGAVQDVPRPDRGGSAC